MKTGERETVKKILITGSSGFVGARIVHLLSKQYEFITIDSKVIRHGKYEELYPLISELRPFGIINTAAISDTAYCEKHRDESFLANVLLPETLARVSAQVGCKLINFSSDQVYCAEREIGPFDETLDVQPSNVYGRHKLEAEKRVLSNEPDAVCLRASWMYDLEGDNLPIRGNLPINLLNSYKKNECPSYPVNDFRGITYVRHVARNISKCLYIPGGVYNFGSENDCNMYETATAFAAILGLKISISRGERSEQRSLLMDIGKLRRNGIDFENSIQGFKSCSEDHFSETYKGAAFDNIVNMN